LTTLSAYSKKWKEDDTSFYSIGYSVVVESIPLIVIFFSHEHLVLLQLLLIAVRDSPMKWMQVEIVMGLEEAFSITVDESSAQEIKTVEDAATLIDKLVTEKEG
jgi:hypothetical protein